MTPPPAIASAKAGPPGLIFRPDSYVDRLDLAKIFPTPQPLEVELGAGDGSFLIQCARAHPQHNFLAVERLLGRIRKIERKAARAALANVRLLRIEAAYFLEYLLPRASVHRLHVYFPDPWPKRKHWKNRLVNPAFADTCARVLAPAGRLYLRTDDPHYFAQMQSVFAAHPAFTSVPTPPDLAALTTDFERHFHTQNIPTLHTAYQLQNAKF